MLGCLEEMQSSNSSSASTKSFCLNLCIRRKLQILGGCIYISKVFNTIDMYIIIGLIFELHIFLKGDFPISKFDMKLTCYCAKQCANFISNFLSNEICVRHWNKWSQTFFWKGNIFILWLWLIGFRV